jgi:hypothetical protein
MDKISQALGDKPADRGGLGYLCSGKGQGILYRGNFFKSLSDNEIWPYEVRALHNRYNNLVSQGGFFDDLPTLEGVSLSNLDEPDYFIYETENYILIEDLGIFSDDYYLHKKE